MTGPTPPVVLTIAGSDPGGGAGIQADLKTFAALGAYGTSALSAITVQSTVGVLGILAVDASVIEDQIRAVCDDFDVRSVKVGMLGSEDAIRVVGALAGEGKFPFLVVDPVFSASDGTGLAPGNPAALYIDHLLPHTDVLTPNLSEAAILLGSDVSDLDGMEKAAVALGRTGVGHVVLKGGHLSHGDATDIYWDGLAITALTSPRIDTPNLHGTGCTFSAAIAALVGLGTPVPEAIAGAKAYTHRAIAGAAHWRLGHGSGPLNHMATALAVGGHSRPGLLELSDEAPQAAGRTDPGNSPYVHRPGGAGEAVTPKSKPSRSP